MLYEGWDELGIEDPNMLEKTQEFNIKNFLNKFGRNRGEEQLSAWEQLVARFSQSKITPKHFLLAAVNGIFSGLYGNDQWYAIGQMFGVPEFEVDDVMMVANDDQMSPTEKREHILRVLTPYVNREVI
jgi:hypothetical protein